MGSQDFNLNKFKLKKKRKKVLGSQENNQISGNKLPRHKKGERFLAGPIPWDWLSEAASLPGHSLHVAIVLWFSAMLKKTATVKLEGRRLKELGVKRGATYRALIRLEHRGLIKVVRHVGRLPIVTLLELPKHQRDGT